MNKGPGSPPAHYDDPEFARRYAQGPVQFVPGYQHMQRMAAQLIGERIGASGQVLVLGAGGGLELEAFASRHAGWNFIGVDPSEEMLKQARERVHAIGASERVQWHHGFVFDAPPGPFDAATCLLALHFVADDGDKQRTLEAIRRRLKPGAPLLLVDHCIDFADPGAELALQRYADFALESGAESERIDSTCERMRSVLKLVGPTRDEALLRTSGFSEIELFYAAFSWRGWRALA